MFVSVLLALEQLASTDSTVVHGRVISELTGAPLAAVDVPIGTESGARTVRTISVEPGTVARVAIEM